MQLQKIKTTLKVGPRKEQTLYGLKAVSRPNVHSETLLAEISSASTFSAADAISIFREFARVVVDQVAAGHTVDMGELGLLRPTLSAKAVNSREECNVRSIRRLGIHYSPRAALTAAAKSIPLSVVSPSTGAGSSSTGTGGNTGNTGTGTGGNGSGSGNNGTGAGNTGGNDSGGGLG